MLLVLRLLEAVLSADRIRGDKELFLRGEVDNKQGQLNRLDHTTVTRPGSVKTFPCLVAVRHFGW